MAIDELLNGASSKGIGDSFVYLSESAMEKPIQPP